MKLLLSHDAVNTDRMAAGIELHVIGIKMRSFVMTTDDINDVRFTHAFGRICSLRIRCNKFLPEAVIRFIDPLSDAKLSV